MRTLKIAIGAAAAALGLVAIGAPRGASGATGESGVGGPADAGADVVDSGTGIPGCMKVTTESRYVPGGYNHVVILANGCPKSAACVVSTDVNPQPQDVVVPPQTTSEVLTFMASPASTFVARVGCVLR
jgi:hypothetical protein